MKLTRFFPWVISLGLFLISAILAALIAGFGQISNFASIPMFLVIVGVFMAGRYYRDGRLSEMTTSFIMLSIVMMVTAFGLISASMDILKHESVEEIIKTPPAYIQLILISLFSSLILVGIQFLRAFQRIAGLIGSLRVNAGSFLVAVGFLFSIRPDWSAAIIMAGVMIMVWGFFAHKGALKTDKPFEYAGGFIIFRLIKSVFPFGEISRQLIGKGFVERVKAYMSISAMDYTTDNGAGKCVKARQKDSRQDPPNTNDGRGGKDVSEM